MAYDKALATRLETLFGKPHQLAETRMFGSFGYLFQGNLCVGIQGNRLTLRTGPARAAELLQQPGIEPMNPSGRVMKGWVAVMPEAMTKDSTFISLCDIALAFVKTLPAK